MIQLTNTNTYLFIMFGTRTYSYESNIRDIDMFIQVLDFFYDT